MSPETRKLKIAGTVFIIVVIASSVSTFIGSDMKQTVASGSAGQIMQNTLYDISLNTYNGNYVRYELTTNTNQKVNVYLMGEDQFYLMRNNTSFNYISADLNVNHVNANSYLEGNQTYFVLVSSVSSSDPRGTVVPVSWTVQQSHYPLVYHDVFNILILPFLALTFLALFFLIKTYLSYIAYRKAQKGSR